MSTTEVILAVLAVVGGAGGIGTFVAGRVFPERQSQSKKRSDRVTELETSGVEYRKDLADCKHDIRMLTDYVHDLRSHIVNGNGPPPPDFPEGMRL